MSAEVILNSKNLGIPWKPPFRVDITAVVKPGGNVLEVKEVNLWPDWLVNHKPRTSGRIAFST